MDVPLSSVIVSLYRSSCSPTWWRFGRSHTCWRFGRFSIRCVNRTAGKAIPSDRTQMNRRRAAILLDFEPPTKGSTCRITTLSVQTERRKWGCIHLLSYGPHTILPSAGENPRHFATNLKTLGTITNDNKLKGLKMSYLGEFRYSADKGSERPGFAVLVGRDKIMRTIPNLDNINFKNQKVGNCPHNVITSDTGETRCIWFRQEILGYYKDCRVTKTGMVVYVHNTTKIGGIMYINHHSNFLNNIKSALFALGHSAKTGTFPSPKKKKLPLFPLCSLCY